MVFIPKWGRYKDRKPSGPVEINWNNTLADALNLAFIFSDSYVDLVSGKEAERFGNAKLDTEGAFFVGLGDYLIFREVALNSKLSAVFNNIYTDNGGNSYQYFLSFGAWTGVDSLNIYLGESSASIAGDRNKLRVAVDSSSLLTTVSASALWPAISGKNCAVTIDETNGKIYVSGTLDNSRSSFGAAPISPTTRRDLYIGGRSDLDAARFFGGTQKYLYLYNRVLSNDEIFELDTAPYQILKPRVKYFDLGATGGSVFSGILSVGSSQLSASAFKKLFSQATALSGNSSASGLSAKTIKTSADNTTESANLAGSSIRQLSLNGDITSESPLIDGQLNTNIIAIGDALSGLASVLGVSTRLLYQNGAIATEDGTIDGAFFKTVSANSDSTIGASEIAGLIGKLLAFSGTLTTDQPTLDGQAKKLHSSSGDLSGFSSTIDGVLIKIAQSIGWLVDGNSAIDASAIKIHDLSGDLATGNSDIFGTSAPIKFINGAIAADSSVIDGALAKLVQANGYGLSVSSAVNGAFAKLVMAQGDQASSTAAIAGQTKRFVYVEGAASANNSGIFGTSSGIRLINGSLQSGQTEIIGQFVKQIDAASTLTSESAQITASLQSSSVLLGQLAVNQSTLDGQLNKIISAIADAVTSQSLIDGESVTLRVLLASGDTVTIDVTMQGQAVKTQHVSGDLSASVSIIQGRFFIGGHDIFFSVVNIIASDSEHTILVSY